MANPKFKLGQTVRINPKVTGTITGILEGNKYLVRFVDPEFDGDAQTAFAESDIKVEKSSAR